MGEAVSKHRNPMHPPVPLAAKNRSGLQSRLALSQGCCVLSDLLRRLRSIERALTLRVKVTETIGLQPIRHNPQQKVTRQVRGRRTTQNVVPLGTKRFDVEIAQSRDLVFDFLPIRQRRTDPHPRHGT
jgi:hypothetical protein